MCHSEELLIRLVILLGKQVSCPLRLNRSKAPERADAKNDAPAQAGCPTQRAGARFSRARRLAEWRGPIMPVSRDRLNCPIKDVICANHLPRPTGLPAGSLLFATHSSPHLHKMIHATPP